MLFALVCAVALVVALAGGCRRRPPAVAAANPVVVDEVRFEGFDVLPQDERDRLSHHLELEPGSTLTDELEKRAGDRAVELLQNRGFPYAQVGIAREPTAPGHARVIVGALPGTLGYFGRIDIAGNRTVDDVIIRRRLAYAPGDVFRRRSIERSQQRIGALGLFKSVSIQAVDIDLQPAEVPTLITVEERSPWRWNLSLGYAAGERIAFETRVSNLNFLGSARHLDLLGRVSSIERTGQVAFTQTEIWHPSLSLALEARHQEIDEPSFFVQSSGGQGAVSWQWTPAFATTAAYAATHEKSDVAITLEPLLSLQDGLLSAVSLDLDDRRVSATEQVGLLPSAIEGWPRQIGSLHLEKAGGPLGGAFDYFNLIGDLRYYRRAFEDRVVFAGRLRYGSTDPSDTDADVPILKRFFLGGPVEMRGWGVFELSPLSPSGEPVGGLAMFTATAEMRVELTSRITGAIFVEGGNAFLDPWAIHFNQLVYDAGPGVRVETPWGLVRFDFGYQLKTLEGLLIDGEPQDHRWRINFGIGEAF